MWSSQPAVAATTSKDATVSDGQQPTTASQLTSPTSQSASNSAIISEETTSDGEEPVGNVADEPVDSEVGAKIDISTDIECWGEVNEEMRSYWVAKGIEAMST